MHAPPTRAAPMNMSTAPRSISSSFLEERDFRALRIFLFLQVLHRGCKPSLDLWKCSDVAGKTFPQSMQPRVSDILGR